MLRKGSLTVLMTLALLLTVIQPALAADADIVISEVMFNSYSINGSESDYEWVEVYNKGMSGVDITDWDICDSSSCDNIDQSDCPSSDCTIDPGEYWLIGEVATGTQTEVESLGATFISTKTISLGSAIGGGLSNATDAIRLYNASGTAIDCVSWEDPAISTCSDMGVGLDTTLESEGNGQSITDIQNSWYYHGPGSQGTTQQGSPYGINTAADGSPTAILLKDTRAVFNGNPIVMGAVIVSLGTVSFFLMRREISKKGHK